MLCESQTKMFCCQFDPKEPIDAANQPHHILELLSNAKKTTNGFTPYLQGICPKLPTSRKRVPEPGGEQEQARAMPRTQEGREKHDNTSCPRVISTKTSSRTREDT